MAYYPSSPNWPTEVPTVAVVQTGNTVWWEGNTVVGTFRDGDTFTSQIISPKRADWSYSGPGNNEYTGFYCYLRYQPDFYTDTNGNTCAHVYFCNHDVPASAPAPAAAALAAEDSVRFDFQVTVNYFTMEGHFTAADMLGAIDKAIGDPYCDNSQNIAIGDGTCTIRFNCHGDVPGQMAKGMAEMLKTVLANTNGIVNYYSQTVKVCSSQSFDPKTGTTVCVYTYPEQAYTQINDGLTMSVVYLPARNPQVDSDQGQFTYAIPVRARGVRSFNEIGGRGCCYDVNA